MCKRDLKSWDRRLAAIYPTAFSFSGQVRITNSVISC
jgi:hypothetical protein